MCSNFKYNTNAHLTAYNRSKVIFTEDRLLSYCLGNFTVFSRNLIYNTNDKTPNLTADYYIKR